MLHLMYVGEQDKKYVVDFEPVNDHVVQITGDFPVKGNGFILTRFDCDDDWDYTGYRTIYRNVDGGAQFSDDGSVYVAPPEPEPEPEPEPYVPTLEEVKESKIMEMNIAQMETVGSGINVTFADGRTEHFDLTEYEQKRLMALQAKVAAGDNKIPWHTSNLDDPCRYYTNEEMMQIINEAMEYATYHETYFRDIRRYINSLEDKESVEAVTYGMVIPEEYRSEVLTDMYAAQEAQQEV